MAGDLLMVSIQSGEGQLCLSFINRIMVNDYCALSCPKLNAANEEEWPSFFGGGCQLPFGKAYGQD